MVMKILREALVEEDKKTFVEFNLGSEEQDEDGHPLEFVDFRIKVEATKGDLVQNIKLRAIQNVVAFINEQGKRFGGS